MLPHPTIITKTATTKKAGKQTSQYKIDNSHDVLCVTASFQQAESMNKDKPAVEQTYDHSKERQHSDPLKIYNKGSFNAKL